MRFKLRVKGGVEVQSVLKGNEDFPSKSKKIDSLWRMQETKKIAAVIDVKLNHSDSLYHCIRSSINLLQG